MVYSCRICLSQDAFDLVSLFDIFCNSETFSQIILLCTSTKMCPVKGLPNEICKSCRDRLVIANEFRLTCLNSDAFLQQNFPHKFQDCEQVLEPLSVDVDNSICLKEIKRELLSDNCHESSCPKSPSVGNAEERVNEVKEENESSSGLLFDDKEEQIFIQPVPKVKLSKRNCVVSKAKKSRWKCEHCGETLSNRSVLVEHIRAAHGQGQGTTISSAKPRKANNARFHCSECPFTTKFSQSLIYHQRLHTGERPHVCFVCNKTFNQPGNLKCHLKTHSDKMYFKCETCGKEFKTNSQYKVHTRIHSADRKVFPCDICGARLKTKQILSSHINRHNNVKNFSCETCGFRFVTSEELNNHSKTHNTVKCFKCDLCDFRTAVKRCLTSHMKRHSNHKPFKCQSCDLACFTKWELSNHEKTHTRECNYPCTLCERTFIQSSSLTKHVQRTHGLPLSTSVDRRRVK